MVLWILFGCLAFWGGLSILFMGLGWLLPKVPINFLFLCPDDGIPDGAIARHSWLRNLGFCHGPLVVVGNIPQQEQEIWKRKHPYVEFMTPEELPSRLELERTI